MEARSGDAGIVAELGEDALIEIFARGAARDVGREILVPNGDDAAAFVTTKGRATIVTTDTLVESIHFDLAYCPHRTVGRKLISVNLSDLASMGARPRYALISVAVSPSTPITAVREIASGIHEQCFSHHVKLIGGNTARTYGPMVLTATLIGRMRPRRVVSRRGSRPGDALFVTGSLGNASGGLRLMQAGTHPIPTRDDPMFPLYTALVDPLPRVGAGQAIAKDGLAHAMCDVSDGLGRDLARLLAPEGLGARIEASALPISPALRSFALTSGLSPETLALEGGEDYELLFAADPGEAAHVAEVLAEVATPVSRIGEVTSREVIEVIGPDGSVTSAPRGFDHFRAGG